MNCLISVIVPCYNLEQFIEKCLRSILDCNDQDLQIIIVNDGSKDNSLYIIEEFIKVNKVFNFLLINQENKGLSAARNKGIDVATGEFIAFIDGDDWIQPNFFSDFRKVINDKVDLLFCAYSREYLTYNSPRVFNLESQLDVFKYRSRLFGLTDYELNDPTQIDSIVTAWGKLFRTKIIKSNKLKFLDTNLIGTEDLFFNIQYSQWIRPNSIVFCIDKPNYCYRKMVVGSLTYNGKINLINQWSEMFNLVELEIQNDDEVKAYRNRICLSIIGLGLNELKLKKTHLNRIQTLNAILSQDRYKIAFKELVFNYFPFHWRMFFLFAKYRLVLGLYLMLLYINNRLS
jgi:glycosyltransferase involved in cell wall biosynthesis